MDIIPHLMATMQYLQALSIKDAMAIGVKGFFVFSPLIALALIVANIFG